MNNPITYLTSWILDEKQQGAPDPQQAILSTVSQEGAPHGRVVAIREINDNNLEPVFTI